MLIRVSDEAYRALLDLAAQTGEDPAAIASRAIAAMAASTPRPAKPTRARVQDAAQLAAWLP